MSRDYEWLETCRGNKKYGICPEYISNGMLSSPYKIHVVDRNIIVRSFGESIVYTFDESSCLFLWFAKQSGCNTSPHTQ